jgi:hypothetical protein
VMSDESDESTRMLHLVTSTFTLVHFISSVSGDGRGKGP